MIRLIFLPITFFLCSCGGQKENFEYSGFRKQVTPNGKYIIYDYSGPGKMAFSSAITGTEVFEADQVFEEGKGKPIKGLISEWISNDTLLVYKFDFDTGQPKDTLPIKTEFEKVGDFVIKQVFYKSNSGSRCTPKFDSIAITKDSITVRLIDKKIISFPLGGIVIQVKSDSIHHILATKLVKGMDFSVKNSDDTYTDNLPRVGTLRYELTPVKEIVPMKQEKKIFWEE